MSFQIIPYEKEFQSQWDEYLNRSKNGCFLFQRKYMEYHQNKFVDASLIVKKNEKIIALFPANKSGSIIFSHQGLTFGGFIYDLQIKAIESLLIMDLMKEFYLKEGFKRIIYKTIPYIFSTYPAQEDLYALFKSNATMYRRDIFSVVEIENSIKFSETKRQAVRKCQTRNIQIIESSDFNDYWNLLKDVLAFHNAKPTHSIEEITMLKNAFPDQIKLFEARDGNVLLAGIVIYDYGRVVHTQYMANSQEGRKLGVLDYINHQLITDIYKDRKYYSFGSSNENEGQYLNEGLIQQKELMGGRAVAHDFYQIDLT